ncbi:small ribosomal subunit Rsm22 family protein [Phenylobacterium deserti]|uniref:rRNA methyltransferase n=1 Tax=Phenylobacterium deserti TaxID=1914756 RepID=A0A328ARB0_9CAUL|nr:small ribosomal subunit Rsm22 family protein [Phenylobacterium deserti]RAK57177.1 rRNA methyltransferase [Phenylobacterium deserti]
MTPELPAPLRAAIDRELQGVSRKGLAERAQRTSAAYRAGQSSAGVIRSAEDALAYALARLPATYAACLTVFAEAERMAPQYTPRRLLDAGSGTAAASWAASAVWPLEQVTWLDSSRPFLEMAARLASEGPGALKGSERIRADLTGAADSWPKADVVCASYALAEIAAERQAAVVSGLWAACEGLLVLVEPGTPAGYARILAARQALIAQGAALLAPCPHSADCPLTGSDWCHFSVRLPRSRDHRLAKGAEVPFEDERFAYLIAARPDVAAGARSPRVLAPPRSGKPGIDLKLCTDQGLEQRFVGKRDKAGHGVARRLGWGDVWPASGPGED